VRRPNDYLELEEAERRERDSAKPYVPPTAKANGREAIIYLPPLFRPTPFVWRDPAELKRREWLFGSHYIRKYVTCTIGRRGGGKTSRAIIEKLSMATGRDLLNTGIKSEKLRVWYIGEDTRDEIEMRIIAACVHHEIRPEEIGDRLCFDSVFDLPRGVVKLATLKGGAVVRNQPAIESLKAGIDERRIDILVLDPLKKFHGVKENDNDMMDDVMTILSEIAMEKNISIEVLHHTRKPGAGNGGAPMTVDDGRGADAIIAAARSARIINGLQVKEAAALSVAENEAWRYVRIDNGKANMAPPGKASWTYSASELLPCGESVGVFETWKPPDTFEGMSVSDIHFIREAAQGGAYRADGQAESNWIGEPLAKRLGLDLSKKEDKTRISKIIKTWMKTGVLDTEARPDETRRMRKYVVPGKWTDESDDAACSTF
jgi:hypothetical protein